VRFKGWYRIVMPLQALAAHGWKIGYEAGRPPPASESYRVLAAQRLDQPGLLREWRRLSLRHRLVYEIDDDVWSIPQTNWAAYHTYQRDNVLDIMEHAAQIADMVTVTTEPLAEVMRRRTGHPCIRVIPNCVPDELLTLRRNRSPRRTVTIGWAGGSSHTMDVAMIAVPVHEFIKRTPRAELHILGIDFRRTFGLSKDRCRYTGWIAASTRGLDYYRALDFDIGLAPLTGTTFDQSKSSIKVAEYFALGIPVLASDCEPYRGVVIDGVNGYLIRKRGDWARRLRELTEDDAAREEMGAKARETARAHTIGAGWRKWASAYEELL
jgi:glycosyltransferase involved in cell wall biosynthesis